MDLGGFAVCGDPLTTNVVIKARPVPRCYRVFYMFTKSEIHFAEETFRTMIEKYFGEVWKPQSTKEYLGKQWECTSMLQLDLGLWYLLQAVKHKNPAGVFGRVQTKNDRIIFTAFYEPRGLILQ